MRRQRNESITFMFTIEEKEKIKNVLEKMKPFYKNYSNCILHLIDTSQVNIIKIDHKEIVKLLTISSNNINQWTKNINILNEVNIEDIQNLKKEVEKMKKVINEYGILVNKALKGEKEK